MAKKSLFFYLIQACKTVTVIFHYRLQIFLIEIFVVSDIYTLSCIYHYYEKHNFIK